MTGLRRSMVYQLEAELRFPKRVKLAARAVGWVEREVHAWMVARIEARQSQPTAPARARDGADRPPVLTMPRPVESRVPGRSAE
jgi:prophage regulatory protein